MILEPLSAQSVVRRKTARMRVASFAMASIGRALAPPLSRRTCHSCQSADKHPSGKSSLSRALRVRACFLRWLSREILDTNPRRRGRPSHDGEVRVRYDILLLRTPDIPSHFRWVPSLLRECLGLSQS